MVYNSWFTHGFHKLHKTETPTEQNSYTLHMAGNGGDCCQLALRHASGAVLIPRLSLVRSVPAGTHGEWPDPLPPLPEELHLDACVSTAVFIRVNAPAGCPAGAYEGDIQIRLGSDVSRFPLSAHVWNFTLPETPACETSIGLNRESIETMHRVQA